MNLYYLRYFVKLAHVQHYTRAAEQLCITQPSLSHAIAQLEKELGVPLFEKTGRKTTLTRFGEEFLPCAEHTLASLDAGVASLQKAAQGAGIIRLGILRTLGVDFIPELAAGFLKENPEREIQFTFHTGVTKQLLSELDNTKYDLVFCSRPSEECHLTAVPVTKQTMVAIVSENHPLAGLERVKPQDLLPYPMIYFSESSGLRQVVDQIFTETGTWPAAACETEEDEVIAGLTAQGFGISVVPYMDLLRKLKLNILPIDSPASERRLYMIHNKLVFMSPAVQAFRQYVLETCVL